MCVWESAQRRGEYGIATFKTVEKEHKRQGIFDRMCRVVAEGEGVVRWKDGESKISQHLKLSEENVKDWWLFEWTSWGPGENRF